MCEGSVVGVLQELLSPLNRSVKGKERQEHAQGLGLAGHELFSFIVGTMGNHESMLEEKTLSDWLLLDISLVPGEWIDCREQM